MKVYVDLFDSRKVIHRKPILRETNEPQARLTSLKQGSAMGNSDQYCHLKTSEILILLPFVDVVTPEIIKQSFL